MKVSAKTTDIGAELAVSLIAGLLATAAMSFSQQIEMKITGRRSSVTPAEALCLMLGIETRTEVQEHRLADEAHWLYGAMWGFGHPLTGGIGEPARTLLYLATVWSAGVALLTGMRLAPPPSEWHKKTLWADFVPHAVYATVGSLAYHALRRVHVLRR